MDAVDGLAVWSFGETDDAAGRLVVPVLEVADAVRVLDLDVFGVAPIRS